jgi:hypothetical protein
MSTFTERSKFSVDAALTTSNLSADLQHHLARVYAVVLACITSAALSCGSVLVFAPSVFLDSQQGEMILGYASLPVSIGLLIWFLCESTERFYRRAALLMGIAASMGLSLVALVHIALDLDPSLILTALYVDDGLD